MLKRAVSISYTFINTLVPTRWDEPESGAEICQILEQEHCDGAVVGELHVNIVVMLRGIACTICGIYENNIVRITLQQHIKYSLVPL